MSDTTAPSLLAMMPALRRYARAATGLASVGDAALHEALPEIAAACAGPEGPPARWRALGALVQVLGTTRVVPLAVGGTLGDAVAALPHEQRHALLLSVLEELPAEAVAAVLSLSAPAVEQRLAAARSALRGLLPARVMIIEDEPLVADQMAQVVSGLGHAVCATAADEAEAWRAAREHRPELILADLGLGAGGSGLNAARRIVATAGPVCLVYVTGHPELLAAEQHAVVVRKPYRDSALRVAIGRALANRPQAGAA